ncbi:MAG TPA: molybdopterin-dependent oxidoreductase, partial [Acidimicrobiales bacterium]|nr:molybdopterin-dependent oxidoreductase [Acidimicrobiales bacterium]
PVLYLRLRHAVGERGAALVELTPKPTALTGEATASLTYRPGELRAVVDALVSGAAAPEALDRDALEAARGALAEGVATGEGVVVVIGRPSLAERHDVVADAVAALAAAWPAARFLPALRRGNVMGALDMGMAPGVLPGRVDLDEGRTWFAAAWGSAPEARGLDTEGMLRALAGGGLAALVLLGADPLGDFPDRTLAEEALDKASFVVAVDTFLSPSAAKADVVLPAVAAHERPGTTTNIEGRVTRLGQKLVSPGQSWPEWMIASELAARMGADLGVASTAELWDEIERLSPAHAGLTRQVLEGDAGRDGVVVPMKATTVTLRRRPVIDPMATPGIEAVERQGAPPRAGLAEPLGGDEPAGGARASGEDGRPAMLRWPRPVEAPHLPAPDGYSLRLVAGRRLYDEGALVEASESLAALTGTAAVRVHPSELERLGVHSGGQVRLRSARGALVLEALADTGVARGVAVVPFNLEADDGTGVSALIDAAVAVVDVRMETP